MSHAPIENSRQFRLDRPVGSLKLNRAMTATGSISLAHTEDDIDETLGRLRTHGAQLALAGDHVQRRARQCGKRIEGQVAPELHPELIAEPRPDVKARLNGIGFDPIGSSGEQFATYIRDEMAKYEKIIKDAKIKVE